MSVRWPQMTLTADHVFASMFNEPKFNGVETLTSEFPASLYFLLVPGSAGSVLVTNLITGVVINSLLSSLSRYWKMSLNDTLLLYPGILCGASTSPLARSVHPHRKFCKPQIFEKPHLRTQHWPPSRYK